MSTVFASRCSHCQKFVSVPESRSGQTIRCVHCRGEFVATPLGQQSKPQETSKGRSSAVAILATIILLLGVWATIRGCKNETSPTITSQPEPILAAPIGQQQGPPISVESFQWARDEYGSRVLRGTAVNNSQKTLKYAQVEFNLYNKDGTQVGSTFANINNFEPGGRWQFEAYVMEKSATKAKLKDITGF